MSFSYGGSPGTSPIDTVRFLVGDTDENEYFLHDGEINWLHETWISKGNVYHVASKAAEAIAAKFARETSFSADGQSVSIGELQQKYQDLAVQLAGVADELLVGGSSLYAGGMDAHQRHDPSVAPLAFGTRMHDHIEAGQQDYGEAGDRPWDWWTGGAGYNP